MAAASCATYQEEDKQSPGAPNGGGGDASDGGSAGPTSGAPTGGTASGGGNGAGAAATPSAGNAGKGGGTSAAGGGSGGVGGTNGVADPGSGGAPLGEGGSAGAPDAEGCVVCDELKSALAHRYDFEGSGTTVKDRVGTADGLVKGASLSKVAGKGVVVLTGGTNGPYVDLPNGLLSALTSATLECWITWGGGDPWQRIFDFGDSNASTPEDNPASGKSYLFVTPMTDSGTGGTLRAVYSLNGNSAAAETRVVGAAALPQTLQQVVVVVNATSSKLIVYVGGVSVGETPFTGSLASVHDVNVWLGRSQFKSDPTLTATFHDFRIYKAALSPEQIAASFAAGADPAFLGQ